MLDLSGPVPTLDGIAVGPIFGATSPAARYGIMSTGDILDSQVLVSKTADGVDLGSLWDEFSELLDVYNNHTTKLCDLLRFPVTIPGSAVSQGLSSNDFEVATEYGAPMAAGPPVAAAVLGYRFDHYDLRSSFTWQYLSRATADEVRAVMNSIIASDLKLVNSLTLRRLFNPNPEHTREGFTAYDLWSNDGSMSPPPFLGTQFPSSTTHYVASQAAVIDSGDVEDLVTPVRTKDYGLQSNSQLLLLCNPQESMAVQTWRVGQPSRPSGPEANHDWVPSVKAPPHYSADVLVGTAVSGELYGLEILGSYGYVQLLETPYCPAGYFAVVATGGPNSVSNVVGFRQSPDTNQQGLRQIPGADWTPYPIIGSYHLRSAGVGVRQRGGAACCQITPSSTYTPPPPPTIPAFRQ